MKKEIAIEIAKGIGVYALIMIYFALVNGGSLSAIGIKSIAFITVCGIAGTVMRVVKVVKNS